MSSDSAQTEGRTDVTAQPLTTAAVSGQRAVYDAVQTLAGEQRWLNHQGAIAMRQVAAMYRGGTRLAPTVRREPVVIELDEVRELDDEEELNDEEELDDGGVRTKGRSEPPAEDAFDAFLATFEPDLPTGRRTST
ncbi:hypothetical protein [Halomarina pelagica]|uniref:hypothetical protein n=1 Tax=Halomarina pelagica TaxID=2961599 RepID=UPI0020C469B1|nr:hypothetical protein [Halomarina sp. BND7]